MAKSGYKGVYRHSSGSSFVARIRVNGKDVYLGSKPTAKQAYELYKVARAAHESKQGRHNSPKPKRK